MTLERWLYYAALLFVAAVTGGAALIDRDAEADRQLALDHAADALLHTPQILGSWHVTEEHALEDAALKMLQCAGYLNRVYQNQDTGEVVSVALFVGPAGPLVAHTPEICMTSQQFEQLGGMEQLTVPVNGDSHQFIRSTFRERSLEGGRLSVYYAWSADGKTWQAPTSPRLTLGPMPLLFKVQVAGSSAAETEDRQSSPSQQLLRELIPVLAKTSDK
jgi:hypothetical protein